jgi:hypothetical protein
MPAHRIAHFIFSSYSTPPYSIIPTRFFVALNSKKVLPFGSGVAQSPSPQGSMMEL